MCEFFATLLMKNLTIVECEYDDLCSIFFTRKGNCVPYPSKKKRPYYHFSIEVHFYSIAIT